MYKYLKNTLMMLCLFVFITGAGAQQNDASLERDWRNDRVKVKVISYNIFNGFDYLKDKDRMSRMTEWLKEQDPDVLALNELCGFTAENLKEFAASYGHPYSAILKENGYPVGITSKKPIEVVSRNTEGFTHGMMHCKVLGLDILSTHLDPSHRDTRKTEADHIVNYIKEKKLTRCILLGDMNAHSPFDSKWTDRDLGDYTVLSTFMAAGLHDLCYMFTPEEDRFSFPTPVLKGTPRSKVSLRLEQERLDYILVTDEIRKESIDACIYNGPENDYLSDHFPVGMTMFIMKEK